MSKDWQKGSGMVAEPKIKKEPWSNKDGYAQAASITPPDKTESQTVTVKGTGKARKQTATWF